MCKILLIASLLWNCSHICAQYFAPLGAEWVYTHYNFGPLRDYNTLTVTDTTEIVGGKKCSTLYKLISNCSMGYEYVYYENNVVFLFNHQTSQFDTLNNFNLNAGEGWGNTIIDSVVYVDVNGTMLKGLYVNGDTFGGPILERIGSPYSFFHENLACDPVDGGFLRCYSDSALGSFTYTLEPCYAIYTTVEENPLQRLTVFPNPADAYVTIPVLANMQIESIAVFDVAGELKLLDKPAKATVDVRQLSNGLHFVRLRMTDGSSFVTKVMIE